MLRPIPQAAEAAVSAASRAYDICLELQAVATMSVSDFKQATNRFQTVFAGAKAVTPYLKDETGADSQEGIIAVQAELNDKYGFRAPQVSALAQGQMVGQELVAQMVGIAGDLTSEVWDETRGLYLDRNLSPTQLSDLHADGGPLSRLMAILKPFADPDVGV